MSETVLSLARARRRLWAPVMSNFLGVARQIHGRSGSAAGSFDAVFKGIAPQRRLCKATIDTDNLEAVFAALKWLVRLAETTRRAIDTTDAGRHQAPDRRDIAADGL